MPAGLDKLKKSGDLPESHGAKNVPLGPPGAGTAPDGVKTPEGGPSEPFSSGTRQHQEVTHAVT